MHFVYILTCLKGEYFYKGLTDNLERRLQQHIDGKVSSTKNKLPIELIHVEICSDRVYGRQMEKFFKSGYGREIIEEIIDDT